MASPNHGLPLSKGSLTKKIFLIGRGYGMTSSKRRFERNLYMEANRRVIMSRTFLLLVMQRRARKIQLESQLHGRGRRRRI